MYSTVSIRIGPLGVQYCVNKDRVSWCTVLCKWIGALGVQYCVNKDRVSWCTVLCK